ncbi:MAG: ABC transporter permease subunit [SAR202 cluster bacterium]|nr:ABC transporter permease subunit [SAR202 cluster bacterium]
MASITSAKAQPKPRHSFFQGRGFLTLILVVAVLWSLASVNWVEDVVHPGGWSAIGQLVKAALTPELSASFLRLGVESAWQTVAYAVAGMCLALAIGFPLGVLASGALARSRGARWASAGGFRFTLGFLRSIHELVWAWLFVVALGLSPMAAVLALGIPYGGILGRIYADILNDVPEQPLRALRSSGASEWKVLLFGRLPMAMPDMLSYSFYRFECALRSAAIMGFVGVGGLGLQIQLSLGDLRYEEVWTLLYFLIAIITLVDGWSAWVRRSMTR